jgi:hypothetical protein
MNGSEIAYKLYCSTFSEINCIPHATLCAKTLIFYLEREKKKIHCPEQNSYLNPFQDSKKTLKDCNSKQNRFHNES